MMESMPASQPTDSPEEEPAIESRIVRAVLLPVKDLDNAKQRLTGVLTPAERTALAQAMLADTVGALRSVTRSQAIFVVTNYEPAMELAAQHGWQVLREEQQISESVSVDFASRLCAERGITHLLRLPLDVPLVRASDIDELLAVECVAPTVLMVPSRDGTGTNAILRTPPTLFPSHFGPDSFAKHRREAGRLGAQVILRRNARLEMDVDDETDVRALLQHDLSATLTGKWLEESGVAARFRQQAFSAQAPR
jgi:2-phospho-L-lactate guanylyltransferase